MAIGIASSTPKKTATGPSRIRATSPIFAMDPIWRNTFRAASQKSGSRSDGSHRWSFCLAHRLIDRLLERVEQRQRTTVGKRQHLRHVHPTHALALIDPVVGVCQ